MKNKDIPIVIAIELLFMFVIRFSSYHAGIIFLLVIFGIILNYDEIKVKSKYSDNIFIVVCILYLILSFQSGINDFLYNYSGSQEMASYIKTNGYDEHKIFCFGYKDVALQSYFEENLFKNMDQAIHRWSSNNESYYIYCNFEDYDKSYFTEVPEYIVIDWNENVRTKMIEYVIENTGKYEIEYRTTGYQFFKNTYSELESYTLYKLKDGVK